jgi:hypothetical protein
MEPKELAKPGEALVYTPQNQKVKLWGVVLPRPTSLMGKTAQLLRMDDTDKPILTRLEWYPDQHRVVVELEPKPEMPNKIIIPESQISAIIPED